MRKRTGVWRRSLRVRDAVTQAHPGRGCHIEPMEARQLLNADPGVTAPPPVTPVLLASIATPVVAAGAEDVRVSVVYTADAKVSLKSVDAADLTVVSQPPSADTPATTLKAVSFSTPESGDASPLAVTYVLAAPGGTWDAADNGTYQVSLASGAVVDTAGASLSGASVTFKVELQAPAEVPPTVPPPTAPPPPPTAPPPPPPPEPPVDREAPKAQIDVNDVRKPTGNSLAVTVQFEDDLSIDLSTVGAGDLQVSGPDGKTANVRFVGSEARDGGRKVTAKYLIEPPGGRWDAADNGDWSIALLPDAVKDGAGKSVASESEKVKVDIDGPVSPPPASPPPASPPPASPPVSPPPASPPPASPPPQSPHASPPPPATEPPANTAPVVSIAPLQDVDRSGSETYTIAVTYRDADGIDASSIGADDLRVLGPGGELTISSVRVDGPAEARTAVYTVALPGGSWDAADAGPYTVTVRGGAVTDARGATSGAVETGFAVTIAPPPPAVDEGFSGGAPVSSGFVAEAVVTLDDGRVLLAGRQGNLDDGSSRGVLRRLNADGSVDGTFGSGGLVVTPEGSNVAYYAVTVLADGSLLVAGRGDGDVLVQHYKSNGSLNTIFGGGGKAQVDWGTATDTAYGLATLPDGRIVVGGGAGGSFGFARLTVGGAIDTSFGNGGSSLLALGGGNNSIGTLALQADGSIVAAGSADGGVAVVRLLASGQADGSFGTGGAAVVPGLVTRTDLGTADYTIGLAVQSDGRILIANSAGGDFAVARLLPGGSIDGEFGFGGRSVIDFGGDDDADAVLVQSTGDIFVVGTTTLQGGRIAVAALHGNGQLNADFAESGRLTLDAGLTGSGRALHVGSLVLRAFATARGNQVVVGGSEGGANAVSSSGLRRLNVPGAGLLGQFGAVDGRNKKLRFVDGDGTVVTLNLKGGSGQAFYDGSNVDLVLSGVNDNTRLKINAVGGDGRLRLRNLRADGGVRSVIGLTADVSGTVSIGGNAGLLSFGSVSGTIATSGSIGTLRLGGDADRATVLAGADLGDDHQLGGSDGASDAFSSASIGNLQIRGRSVGSLFAAGLNRGNTIFLDSDDAVEGGDASRIERIRIAKGMDDATRFVAGQVGTVRAGGPVDMENDSRFVIL